MKTRRMFAIALCLILLLSVLAGCSAQSGNADAIYGTMGNMGNELSGSGTDSSGSDTVLSDRKLIRKITMDAETEDMEALLSDINGRIAQLGGYIESRNIQNGSAYQSHRYRQATLVIRIPADKLDAFVQQVGDTSNVVATVETSDDVTLEYVDTESRLKVLRTEEERLLQFLSEAASVSDMLTIEKRLTEIQSEIETLTSRLNKFDNLVSYGTVTLNITEVKVFTVVEEEEPTMWEEICDGFNASIASLLAIGRGLLVFTLSASPYLVLLCLIAVGVWLFIRSHDRRKKKNSAPPQTPENE